ncbi:MAG: type II toxin-antitoxin system death-on-curing family toxin [Planctomyces sp.]|jgi:death-on-curing protein
MRYLVWEELLELHECLTKQSGGSSGLRDQGLAESSLAQPMATFGGVELYNDLSEKAANLCFSLVMNHPFVDGNKRIGHAAMEVMLILNGYELDCDVDEAESTILRLASGNLSRNELTTWVRSKLRKLPESIRAT